MLTGYCGVDKTNMSPEHAKLFTDYKKRESERRRRYKSRNAYNHPYMNLHRCEQCRMFFPVVYYHEGRMRCFSCDREKIDISLCEKINKVDHFNRNLQKNRVKPNSNKETAKTREEEEINMEEEEKRGYTEYMKCVKKILQRPLKYHNNPPLILKPTITATTATKKINSSYENPIRTIRKQTKIDNYFVPESVMNREYAELMEFADYISELPDLPVVLFSGGGCREKEEENYYKESTENVDDRKYEMNEEEIKKIFEGEEENILSITESEDFEHGGGGRGGVWFAEDSENKGGEDGFSLILDEILFGL